MTRVHGMQGGAGKLIVPLLLFAIAGLASYLPARRATEVDLISAFREG